MKLQLRKINNNLLLLIDHILSSLDELKNGCPGDDFILGQKYAYPRLQEARTCRLQNRDPYS